MSSNYLKCFPHPLLDDLIEGRWLPIIGAGFSLNAIVPDGRKMLLWDELGRELAKEMEDYPYTGAMDAISAFSHEFSRAKLIERLSDLLLIEAADPGQAHRAFAEIPFDIVCTTNFDFLLEKAYGYLQRYCRPIIDETQLSINMKDAQDMKKDASIRLLKLHGDIHHPQRMVVTENDYDLFISHYPLIATYLANLMITRTPVFIGYSLDDPDFRMIWQLITERLGELRRQAYVILVDPKSTEISRYERRKVKVINLSGAKSEYGYILMETFHALRNYVRYNTISKSQVTEDDPLQELTLPKDSISRICFFNVSFKLLPFYKERIFPVAREYGLVPVTGEEVISPGESINAKIDALISRATAVVIDASNRSALYEFALASQIMQNSNILIITEDKNIIPSDISISSYRTLIRSEETIAEPDKFINEIRQWFESIAKKIESELAAEPQRLLRLKLYRPAVSSAFTLLEIDLKKRLKLLGQPDVDYMPLFRLLNVALEREQISKAELEKFRIWTKVRNMVVHTDRPLPVPQAKEIVAGIVKFVQKLPSDSTVQN